MHVSSFLLSPLVLLVGLLPLPTQAGKKWDPFFDYTNLPPTNEVLWSSLGQTRVQLEQAIEVAKQSEGEFRVHNAKLMVRPEGAFWALELFVGAATDKPKRVNLRVSAAEPKVLQRVELLSLAPGDDAVWDILKKTKVPLEEAIGLCKKAVLGDLEEPALNDPRARKADFMGVPGAPIWNVELMGVQPQDDVLLRIQYEVNSQLPRTKRRLLRDRFVGEPLRQHEPTELPNGLLTYDFVQGDGQVVTADSKVQVNYRLFLLDGNVIFDTWARSIPVTFEISKAPLKGMTEGLLGMRVGGRRKIVMPHALAFGEAGNEIAPPKATIVCDIAIDELVTE